MAKEKAPAPAPAAEHDQAARALHWIQSRKNVITYVIAVVAVVAAGVWFFASAKTRRERFAGNELRQARVSVEAGNLTLAASDLGRIVTEYGTTAAGQEASILLARVHIQLGQADLAVSELRTFLSTGPSRQFVAPAHGLLGTALEQLGQFREAAAAFKQAADNSAYELVQVQFLLDAGRSAALAGDTASAIAAYQDVISIAEDEPAGRAALLRLGELER